MNLITITKIFRKSIPGFPGYEIDSNGDVWSYKWTKVRKLKPEFKKGYLVVGLMRNNKQRPRLVHRLVLETFISECPKGFQGCHNNGIRTDNRLENLRWDTVKNNHADMKSHGTWRGGENNGRAKLKNEDIPLVWELLKNSHLTLRRIGEIFGVSRAAIVMIKSGRTWKHIK